MSTYSIQQGLMSTKGSDTGVYGARLKAFQENYKKPEFAEIAKEFSDIVNADKIRADKFKQAALGSKVNPSSSELYQSQYVFAKNKFDLLYSDETLQHYSKSPELMLRWSNLVDELSAEIDLFEGIYEDSFGDMNNSTGKEPTYAGGVARMNQAGSNQAYWESQGFEDVSGKDTNETMKLIDQPLHYNMTLDFENHSFNYESDYKYILEPQSPAFASELFGYKLKPTKVLSPAEYAVKTTFESAFETGEEGFGDFLKRMHTDPMYLRSSIAQYIEDMDVDDYTVDDFINGNVSNDHAPLEQILSGYDTKVINASAEFAEQKKRKKNKTTASEKANQKKADLLATTLKTMADQSSVEYTDIDDNSTTGDMKIFNLLTKSIYIEDGGEEFKLKRIGIDDEGDLYAYLIEEIPDPDPQYATVRPRDVPTIEIGRYKEIEAGDNITNQLESGLDALYGTGALKKFIDKALN
tara:strand:- start:170 stop:1570 length:1401 start_codon:yes stop_codon:yes gene_type:complete